MRLIICISAAILFLAVFPFPIGYYTLLRLIVSITAGLLCVRQYKNDNILMIVINGFILLLFNPIYPIYLGDKSTWIPIDIITGIFLVYQAITYKSLKSIESV
ncbi:conserved hypothetical protein, membrane [Christiangramia forsetii KT0803]|uniref:Uncharacterized protein n=1 Tax=Christiangramia forsetii (strain DSM 17595 / CGMCC 1.15422 / KT0803) TaxID=411154 RepID=A0M4L6_CHRFK|nr:conserved hypothetical protein, membrane [Christiangramia forsetii KT0803]